MFNIGTGFDVYLQYEEGEGKDEENELFSVPGKEFD